VNERALGATHAISPEDLEKVLGTVDIPSCPGMVAEVMAEAQRDEPDLKRLAALFTKDPGMSAIAIKLANSALFRNGPAVDSVSKALNRLGTRNVVCVVVAAALRASMDGAPPQLVERFWTRASSLAMASGVIARRLYGVSPDLAYLYALFRDAAVPVLMKRFPDYDEMIGCSLADGLSRVAAETACLPCTHPVIGFLLVQNWKLPEVIGVAIRFHHETDVYELGEGELPGIAQTLIAVGQLADQLVMGVIGPDGSEFDPWFADRARKHLGLGDEDLADLVEAVESALR